MFFQFFGGIRFIKSLVGKYTKKNDPKLVSIFTHMRFAKGFHIPRSKLHLQATVLFQFQIANCVQWFNGLHNDSSVHTMFLQWKRRSSCNTVRIILRLYCSNHCQYKHPSLCMTNLTTINTRIYTN